MFLVMLASSCFLILFWPSCLFNLFFRSYFLFCTYQLLFLCPISHIVFPQVFLFKVAHCFTCPPKNCRPYFPLCFPSLFCDILVGIFSFSQKIMNLTWILINCLRLAVHIFHLITYLPMAEHLSFFLTQISSLLPHFA